MTRIAITVEAYQALVATLPLGSVAYEPEPNAKGERVIWLEEVWLSKLNAMRKPGESYSDVILRLVELRG
jgi:predicted CopG family antitoxin